MKDTAPRTTRLADYRPFGWRVTEVHLTFRLAPGATRVLSRIRFAPLDHAPARMTLDGEGLTLISALIDGAPVSPDLTTDGLTVDVPPAPFLWEAEVEIAPEGNTALEGLYMSGGIYCTQCEAEGFRRITYYPDRPDVMAPFTVRIESDLPVLLSNGNPTGSGPGFAEWHDPWPKPSYLFALVAGNLVATSASFQTAEGRDVELNVWVRPGDEGRTGYALDSLIRSMRWDEDRFGRVYDLDVFNIVAVDDFNAGAMENKGLNIFNSKYVLASPETATDRDFEGIEAVVAHEYFHNWTGNRITCRDWFQLCLKEGLTVYRDQEFTSDMRSRAVKRIEDALLLRAAQFREDAGPLAHPPRPDTYVEINNFYTVTVYEKGAEVVRMLASVLGPETFATGLELYFARHDGHAATIEEFFACFQEVAGDTLDGFARWWTEAGTPRVTVSRHWDGETLTLSVRQETLGGPRWIPLAVGLLGPDGEEIAPTTLLTLKDTEAHWRYVPSTATWETCSAPNGQPKTDGAPLPSINRGFSAPVLLEAGMTDAERRLIFGHDTDPFNRWDAGRQLIRAGFIGLVTEDREPDPETLAAMGRAVRDDALDPAFRALVMGLPSDDDIAQTLAEAGRTPDPDLIETGRERLREAIAALLAGDLRRLYADLAPVGPYRPDADGAGRRALRCAALSCLSVVDGPDAARALYSQADNMTERLAALSVLLRLGAAEDALADFHARWSRTPDVLDKWFALQVGSVKGSRAVETALRLTRHPDFDWRRPNRVRSVLGTMLRHHAGFHSADGAGYKVAADWIVRLDPANPQLAAGLTSPFQTWRRYDGDRQGMMRDALERIASADGLSRDTSEMVGRILGG
ncbi:aminopeptidase N [Alphaproteobacteria bacterium GH1-50]|uniref:Aminopeptidase N n=1 Tax=Kangsaoukella pontilimi TaxID=2691042 RepID=A0A7C9MB74_9RHOB|nr:aminopeptidase N [Kangsaoukella pontilimi]